jgi:hypothetical protein
MPIFANPHLGQPSLLKFLLNQVFFINFMYLQLLSLMSAVFTRDGKGKIHKPGFVFVTTKIECRPAGTLHIKRKHMFIVVNLFGLCFSFVVVKVVLEPYP